jgi:tetratricopeptide (TPR) repeat protein
MEIAGAHSNLAQVVRAQGDYALAASLLERALTIFRRLEAFTFVAWSLNHLGDIARESGDPLHARQLYEEGADMFKDLGDRWGMARSRLDLGHLSCEGGDTVGATASFRMALEMFVQLDHKRGIAKVLEGFARVSVFRRDYLRAITLRGAATFLRHSLGAHARADEHTALEQDLAAAYLDQDPGEANAAWTAGSNMPLDRAIRYALEP